jgi:hypothetical protein
MSLNELLRDDEKSWANLRLNQVSFDGISQLSVYDANSFQVTLIGARTDTITILYTKIGNIVTLYFPQVIGTAAANATITTPAIAADIRPQAETFFILRGQENSALLPIAVQLATSGVITFANVDGAAFTNAAGCGFYGSSVSYLTA